MISLLWKTHAHYAQINGQLLITCCLCLFTKGSIRTENTARSIHYHYTWKTVYLSNPLQSNFSPIKNAKKDQNLKYDIYLHGSSVCTIFLLLFTLNTVKESW